MKKNIYGETLEGLQYLFKTWEEPAWRSSQVLDWFYHRFSASFDDCSNLPKPLRQRLEKEYECYLPELITVSGSENATLKYLWRLEDGNLIESVLIPANSALYGEKSDRKTLCVSTQVGCACGCKFCASGRSGFLRNLTPAEIVSQLVCTKIQKRKNGQKVDSDQLVSNIVVMGMGEPMFNYENLMTALDVINSSWGCGIGARKITISTSGVVPGILKLAAHPAQYRLAISLHAVADEIRNQIMPINKRFPLSELFKACEKYVEEKGRMLSFEYILIDKLNDSPEQCWRLSDIARRFHAHVNLIPYNSVAGCNFKRPRNEIIQSFFHELESEGVSVTCRQEKGGNIDAACGQLRLRKMKELE